MTTAFQRQMQRKAQRTNGASLPRYVSTPAHVSTAPPDRALEGHRIQRRRRNLFCESRTYAGGRLPFPIRGTGEWDERERRRKECGCTCISTGPLP